MAKKHPPKAEKKLSFLVFKENHSARTLQIPLGWIRSIGWLLGLAAVISLGASFFAVKFYYAARQASPARVQSLERELEDLKASYKSTESKTPQSSPASPVPEGTITHSTLFSALPATSTAPIPERSTLPFELGQQTVTWKGNVLKVHFSIQYTRGDNGNQQGHIIILARGGQTLLTYPEAVFNRAGSASLINPEQGEYFSVSRFREVNAEFPAVNSRNAIQEVEVLILDTSGQVLLIERLQPQKVQAAPKPQQTQPQASPQPTG